MLKKFWNKITNHTVLDDIPELKPKTEQLKEKIEDDRDEIHKLYEKKEEKYGKKMWECLKCGEKSRSTQFMQDHTWGCYTLEERKNYWKNTGKNKRRKTTTPEIRRGTGRAECLGCNETIEKGELCLYYYRGVGRYHNYAKYSYIHWHCLKIGDRIKNKELENSKIDVDKILQKRTIENL